MSLYLDRFDYSKHTAGCALRCYSTEFSERNRDRFCDGSTFIRGSEFRYPEDNDAARIIFILFLRF